MISPGGVGSGWRAYLIYRWGVVGVSGLKSFWSGGGVGKGERDGYPMMPDPLRRSGRGKEYRPEGDFHIRHLRIATDGL